MVDNKNICGHIMRELPLKYKLHLQINDPLRIKTGVLKYVDYLVNITNHVIPQDKRFADIGANCKKAERNREWEL